MMSLQHHSTQYPSNFNEWYDLLQQNTIKRYPTQPSSSLTPWTLLQIDLKSLLRSTYQSQPPGAHNCLEYLSRISFAVLRFLKTLSEDERGTFFFGRVKASFGPNILVLVYECGQPRRQTAVSLYLCPRVKLCSDAKKGTKTKCVQKKVVRTTHRNKETRKGGQPYLFLVAPSVLRSLVIVRSSALAVAVSSDGRGKKRETHHFLPFNVFFCCFLR